jgi:hypothetical protein
MMESQAMGVTNPRFLSSIVGDLNRLPYVGP